MPIRHIDGKQGRAQSSGSWDLDETVLSACPLIPDFRHETSRLRENARILRDVPVEDLVEFFDAASRRVAGEAAPGQGLPPGIAYLVSFLGKPNLDRFLQAALKGNPGHLDGFLRMESLGKRLYALPRGLITHWLAGNVPSLGLISLVQGLLTKNANVVKLPRRNGLALPGFFWKIAGIEVRVGSGRILSGRILADSVLFVYCDPTDKDAHRQLSLASDVRVAWGGEDAINAVMGLPGRAGAEDVFFGPRHSLAIVGRDSTASEGLDKLADKLAKDASYFDQHGCHSPHTVFVERGGAVTALDFARRLASAMDRALKRVPKEPAGAEEAYRIAVVRAEYAVAGEVFASKGTEWTVAYSEERGLARPLGSRVLFVRPVDQVEDVLEWLNPDIQTIGLALEEPRRTSFALHAARLGISRITPIGAMSLYDYPWDGLFPMERFVRWVSLD
jgi:hypothetical protein